MYQADRAGPRFYLDLYGEGHLPPYEGQDPAEQVVARVTTDFLDRYLAGTPGGPPRCATTTTNRGGHPVQREPAPAPETAAWLAHGRGSCRDLLLAAAAEVDRPGQFQRDDAAAKGQAGRQKIFDGLLSRLDEAAS